MSGVLRIGLGPTVSSKHRILAQLCLVNHGATEEAGVRALSEHLRGAFPELGVVHFAPGGGVDAVARILSEPLGALLGYRIERAIHEAEQAGIVGPAVTPWLLARVAAHGYIDDYAGVRVSRTGRRFGIEGATVWNLIDGEGRHQGQAATCAVWRCI